MRFTQFLRADTNRDAGEKQYDYDDETPESDTVIFNYDVEPPMTPGDKAQNPGDRSGDKR